MSEGFHVCNRSRRNCPILVMSPDPKLYETFQIYAIGHARLLKGLWEIKERLARASGLLGLPHGLITEK